MATDNKPPAKKFSAKKGYLLFLGIFITGLIIIIVSLINCGGYEETPDLNATVSFDGTQFHISNNDNYDWTDVTMKLNNDYELSAPLVAAQTEYTVGCMQFTKSDGTRFNPLTMKAQRFFIWAYNGENKRASWAASWK